jgi:hypothetical protein
MNDAYRLAWAKVAREAEAAIDLSRFPLRLQVQILTESFGVEIAVRMDAFDRDAPAERRERMALGTSETISFDQLEQLADFVDRNRVNNMTSARKAALVERALAFVRCVVLHELDECTQVNGVRIYDPHIPERRRFDAHP